MVPAETLQSLLAPSFEWVTLEAGNWTDERFFDVLDVVAVVVARHHDLPHPAVLSELYAIDAECEQAGGLRMEDHLSTPDGWVSVGCAVSLRLERSGQVGNVSAMPVTVH
jgi:hypothetical protein